MNYIIGGFGIESVGGSAMPDLRADCFLASYCALIDENISSILATLPSKHSTFLFPCCFTNKYCFTCDSGPFAKAPQT